MMELKKLNQKNELELNSIISNFFHQPVDCQKSVKFLSDKRNIIYACVEDENVVAYVLGYQLPRIDNGNDMLYIHHVCVSAEYRRKGIAKKLLNMALEYAQKENLHYVYLITQTDNLPARRLYESCNGYNHPKNKELYYWYFSAKGLNND